MSTTVTPFVQLLSQAVNLSPDELNQAVADLGYIKTAGSGIVDSVVGGTGIDVDSTDPANPIVSVSGGTPDLQAVLAAGADANFVPITEAVLVAPALGTPLSGVMTNVTGLPLTTGVTGVLPVANGGTAFSVAAATLDSTPSNPTGTNSATAVMSGLALSFTPVRSGKLRAVISGTSNMDSHQATIDMRWGTGSAPANGDAVTGTLIGLAQKTGNSAATANASGFQCRGRLTGLTLNTALWFDLSALTSGGGNSTLTGLQVTIIED